MIRIDIINDGTGDRDSGNYFYSVHLPGETISGRYEDHQRDLGWAVLVREIIHAADSQQRTNRMKRTALEAEFKQKGSNL